jgi:acyl CoA:acetate/3-ketoacid CoA transferase beta subunit
VSQQSQKRLIPELNYITSPGTNVSTLVTDLGVFEKQDGRLILTQYFENPDESTDNAIENIRSRCGWELEVSENVSAAQPPSQNDLLLLRLFDSRNDFFKHSQQLAEVTL